MIGLNEFNVLITNTLSIETASTALAVTLAFSPHGEQLAKQTQSFIADEMNVEQVIEYKTALLNEIEESFILDLRQQMEVSLQKMNAEEVLFQQIKNDPEYAKGDSIVATLKNVTPKSIGDLTLIIDDEQLAIALMAFIVNEDFKNAVRSVNVWAASMDPEQKEALNFAKNAELLIEAFTKGNKIQVQTLVSEHSFQENDLDILGKALMGAVESNDNEVIQLFSNSFPDFFARDEDGWWLKAAKRSLETGNYSLLSALIEANDNTDSILNELIETLINDLEYEETTNSDIERISVLLKLLPNYDVSEKHVTGSGYRLTTMIERNDLALVRLLLSYKNIMDDMTSQGVFPVRSAVDSYNIDALLTLESFGVDLNIASSISSNYTLLGGLLATSGDEGTPGKVAMIQLLLDRGLRLTFNNDRGVEDRLANFYADGRDDMSVYDAYTFLRLDTSLDESLVAAIKSGDGEAIKKILADDDSLLDHSSRISPTPLEQTMMYGSLHTINELNEIYPLSINISYDGWQALLGLLIQRGDKDVFEHVFRIAGLDENMISLDTDIVDSLLENDRQSFLQHLVKEYDGFVIKDDEDNSVLGPLIELKDLDLLKYFARNGAKAHSLYKGLPLVYHLGLTFSYEYVESVARSRTIDMTARDKGKGSMLAYIIESKSHYLPEDIEYIEKVKESGYGYSVNDAEDLASTARVLAHYSQASGTPIHDVLEKFEVVNFIEKLIYGAQVNSKTELLVELFSYFDNEVFQECFRELLVSSENTVRLVLKAANQAQVSDDIRSHLVYFALTSETYAIYDVLISLENDINQPVSQFSHHFDLSVSGEGVTYLGALILDKEKFSNDEKRFIQQIINLGARVTPTDEKNEMARVIIQHFASVTMTSEEKVAEMLKIEESN